MVQLGNSKLSALLAANAIGSIGLGIYKLSTTLFLSRSLTSAERSELSGSIRYTLTETCLALNIFRSEINLPLFFKFVVLVTGKGITGMLAGRTRVIQGWEEERNMMEEGERRKSEKHSGIFFLSILLLIFFNYSIVTSLSSLLSTGPSASILFIFEYSILALSTTTSLTRYILYLYGLHVERKGLPWHGRQDAEFVVEGIQDGVRFAFYVGFACVVMQFYGVPLNVVRELWVSYGRLKEKVELWVRYRNITGNLNERFEDGTREELDADSCVICREPMEEGKRLDCGHCFHFWCLRQWLLHKQTCPTCRSLIRVGLRRQEEEVVEGAGGGGGGEEQQQQQEEEGGGGGGEREGEDLGGEGNQGLIQTPTEGGEEDGRVGRDEDSGQGNDEGQRTEGGTQGGFFEGFPETVEHVANPYEDDYKKGQEMKKLSVTEMAALHRGGKRGRSNLHTSTLNPGFPLKFSIPSTSYVIVPIPMPSKSSRYTQLNIITIKTFTK
ncbi:hypothetical protein TrCOL_g13352 [Triparma columacea]|uniref:RING-type E3 ubiquitin transferase n=1 Tax=Triparma columacea TaxID=722753 RepID=A0A9W7LGC6_9STRA|nr:hypothetical protein TrCOL_g13352 [Triparma columacea]